MNINLTLIGQLLSFWAFVIFTMKFVWPPIVKALEERKAHIADGLAAAERGQREQELAEKRAKELLHEAKGQAAEIISQAQKRSSEIVDEAKQQARGEGQRLITAAQAEIEQEVNRAREQLRDQVTALALKGAERILGREINAETHRGILDQVVQEI